MSEKSRSRDEGEQAQFENTSDFANYFCTYAFLFHQKQMLEDKRRMNAYHDAIIKNPHHFKDKVVLDVGTGSGILAIWAAKAGAKKVYAVEATQVTKHARVLVEAAGYGNVIEVIQRTVEDLDLPEKVDVIVSEWMGYFLLRESMLDSVLLARDRWLKPDGLMYPSRADMSVAPVNTDDGQKAESGFQHAVQEWHQFVASTKGAYDVDMGCLTAAFRAEHRDYYLGTASWQDMDSSDLIGSAFIIKELDLYKAQIGDFKTFESEFACSVTSDSYCTGFCGWFNTTFDGRPENPAQTVVRLDTAPGLGYTHWGQQLFPLHPGIYCKQGQKVTGSLLLGRQKENQRLLEITIKHSVGDSQPLTNRWQIQ